jgi:hypothetical protein
MNTLNRFKAPLLVATALALPLITNGCSAVEDAQGAVCCTEFKAGATIDGSPDTVVDVTETWTFSRQLGARDPNWLLVATGSDD